MAAYRSAAELRGVLCIRQAYLAASTTTPLVQGGQFRECRVVLHGQCWAFAGRLCAARKSPSFVRREYRTSPVGLCDKNRPLECAEAAPFFSSLSSLPRADGWRLLEGRLGYRPTSGEAWARRRSCRASSTTCTAEFGGNPPASPPKFPDARAP